MKLPSKYHSDDNTYSSRWIEKENGDFDRSCPPPTYVPNILANLPLFRPYFSSLGQSLTTSTRLNFRQSPIFTKCSAKSVFEQSLKNNAFIRRQRIELDKKVNDCLDSHRRRRCHRLQQT